MRHDQMIRVEICAGLLAFVCGVGLLAALGLVLHAAGLRRRGARELRVLAISITPMLLVLASYIYGVKIEADWLETTFTRIPTSKLAAGSTYRIVLISDLHVSGMTPALAELPARINALAPDLVIYTGDSLNSAAGLPALHETLRALHAKDGRFAVKGNHDVWYWADQDLFGDGVATELTGNAVRVGGGAIVLCGAPYESEQAVIDCLATNPDGLRIAAYHSPDLVEALTASATLRPDVMLAGHTHGGQVRVPFYGAVETASRFDKKYEMGLYQLGRTTLYVTRGIGFEPPPAPRVRFLCRPEIAVIDLVGGASDAE